MHSASIGSRRPPRGSILIVMLVTLAILGALAAGSFFAAFHEERIGSAAMLRVRALAAAEHAAYTAISPLHWRTDWNLARPVRLVASDSETLPGRASGTAQIWKLTPFSALVIADGSAGSPPRSAHRRISLLVALQRPVMPTLAAAIARSGVSVTDGSSITGSADTLSDDCLTADSGIAAVSVPPGVSVDTAACGSVPCLLGTPPVRDTILAALPKTSERFGQVDRSFLATIGRQLANSELSPAPIIDAHGECDASAQANLGDPLRLLGSDSPCFAFFPLVHAEGDLRLSGGAGQGMLVVDGSLTLAEGARFTGVLLVRGTARLEGHARLDGIVLADRVSLAGESEVRYSACAVAKAARSGARPSPEESHSWAEMF